MFLFRRLNGCTHKHSCVENVARKLYDWTTFYAIARIPIYYLAAHLQGEGNNLLDKSGFMLAEVVGLLILGGLSSAGCLVRFMTEEVIAKN